MFVSNTLDDKYPDNFKTQTSNHHLTDLLFEYLHVSLLDWNGILQLQAIDIYNLYNFRTNMNNNNNTTKPSTTTTAPASTTSGPAKAGTWGNYANAGYDLNQIPKTEVLYRKPKK
ncbi:hypothetical protein CYY_001921 [Polysphondylium violaceum]|uniref:Uncharacterized protein n=1 Tax=Polysphondylium violaceum TaxID=133409 RepID=A0A8J4Q0J3_9MYCE|nr:hypothetical protein CYY_001921 [Polysphondylium violaceum]